MLCQVPARKGNTEVIANFACGLNLLQPFGEEPFGEEERKRKKVKEKEEGRKSERKKEERERK